MAAVEGECLFGQNWAKISRRCMDVRIFARKRKLIWDQLLATKAEIIQSSAVFSFAFETPQLKVTR